MVRLPLAAHLDTDAGTLASISRRPTFRAACSPSMSLTVAGGAHVSTSQARHAALRTSFARRLARMSPPAAASASFTGCALAGAPSAPLAPKVHSHSHILRSFRWGGAKGRILGESEDLGGLGPDRPVVVHAVVTEGVPQAEQAAFGAYVSHHAGDRLPGPRDHPSLHQVKLLAPSPTTGTAMCSTPPCMGSSSCFGSRSTLTPTCVALSTTRPRHVAEPSAAAPHRDEHHFPRPPDGACRRPRRFGGASEGCCCAGGSCAPTPLTTPPPSPLLPGVHQRLGKPFLLAPGAMEGAQLDHWTAGDSV